MLLNHGCTLLYANLHYCDRDPLEEVQRAGGSHAGHAGAVDGAKMNPRHVEAEGRRLQTSLHHLQRTGQYGSDCPPTSGRKARGVNGRTGPELTVLLATRKIRNCQ